MNNAKIAIELLRVAKIIMGRGPKYHHEREYSFDYPYHFNNYPSADKKKVLDLLGEYAIDEDNPELIASFDWMYYSDDATYENPAQGDFELADPVMVMEHNRGKRKKNRIPSNIAQKVLDIISDQEGEEIAAGLASDQ